MLLLFSCFYVPPLPADTGETFLGASLSWDLGLRCSLEHRFPGSLGLKAGVGPSVLLLPFFIADRTVILSQEALAVIHFSRPLKPFQYGLGLGLPVSGMIWYPHEVTGERFFSVLLAPGGSFYWGYRSPRGVSYRLWFGAGYPVVYDAGEWRWGTNQPLGLWWDLDLEVLWPLR
ncbi:MAG: hypothetical protein JW760_08210 [Spirochaetales bacterium]|nr:hypothetical protein [Spirochaetales bacterium]